MPEEAGTSPTRSLERKLATILSSDVAEYSRLMAADEEETLRTFRARKEVFDQLVSLHRGRVFNTAGDAILAEFTSAIAFQCDHISWGSVSASGDVQIEIYAANADKPRLYTINLAGSLHDGRLDATGSFVSGRSANLHWLRQ